MRSIAGRAMVSGKISASISSGVVVLNSDRSRGKRKQPARKTSRSHIADCMFTCSTVIAGRAMR